MKKYKNVNEIMYELVGEITKFISLMMAVGLIAIALKAYIGG